MVMDIFNKGLYGTVIPCYPVHAACDLIESPLRSCRLPKPFCGGKPTPADWSSPCRAASCVMPSTWELIVIEVPTAPCQPLRP